MTVGDAVSIRVVERVAEREGTDPVDLRPPLHDAIDAEALDALIRSADSDRSVTVEFPYRGYDVRVDGSGDVHVSEPTADAGPNGRAAGELSGN